MRLVENHSAFHSSSGNQPVMDWRGRIKKRKSGLEYSFFSIQGAATQVSTPGVARIICQAQFMVCGRYRSNKWRMRMQGMGMGDRFSVDAAFFRHTLGLLQQNHPKSWPGRLSCALFFRALFPQHPPRQVQSPGSFLIPDVYGG